MSTAITPQLDVPQPPKGINGFLLVFVISLFGSALIYILMLYTLGLTGLVKFLFEIVPVLAVTSAIQIIRKKKSGQIWSAVFLGYRFVLGILMMLATIGAVGPNAADVQMIGILWFLWALVYGFVWGVYLFRSKRVAATLVN
jgi:membrane-associated HD superfamily phosphohydrolase